jgi:GNAT superfamily N-acetyltransferase
VSVVCRAARLDDEAVALELLEELFAPPGSQPSGYSRERARTGFRHAVEDADADVLLAIDGARPVGLASVYAQHRAMRFGRRCWLEDLIVRREERSRGIGRLLLDAASAWGRTRGCTHLKLESARAREAAHRFYTSNSMLQTSLAFQRDIS